MARRSVSWADVWHIQPDGSGPVRSFEQEFGINATRAWWGQRRQQVIVSAASPLCPMTCPWPMTANHRPTSSGEGNDSNGGSLRAASSLICAIRLTLA